MTDHHPPGGSSPAEPDDPRTAARLRRALHARADHIEPGHDGLRRIEERLMPRTSLTDAQKWILGGVAAVAVILALVAVVLAGGDDDGGDVAAGSSTTTTTEETTTTTTEVTTTTQFSQPVDSYAVTFPSPTDSRRFDAPAPAARAYATDVLGFTELALGEIGGSQDDTAEVTLTDREGGPETVVQLERLEGSWFVTGSQAPHIEVSEPSPGTALATPFQTSGRALAFEGTVDVLVLEQGSPLPRGTGFVMGSGTPPPGPFSGRIVYTAPDEPLPGVLVYRTLSAEDGRVLQATSFPVRLTTEQLAEEPEECGDTSDSGDPGEATPDARVVKVFFHCGTDLDEAVALRRTVPADDPAILTNTIGALLAGPTEAERDAGYTSVFPVDAGAPSDQLHGVVIDGGVATIDLSGRIRDQLANSSANTLTLRSEVFRTATQFSSVAAVEILFDGSCESFAQWSQSDSCLVTEP